VSAKEQTDLEGDVVVGVIRQLHGARDLLLQLDCSRETPSKVRSQSIRAHGKKGKKTVFFSSKPRRKE